MQRPVYASLVSSSLSAFFWSIFNFGLHERLFCFLRTIYIRHVIYIHTCPCYVPGWHARTRVCEVEWRILIADNQDGNYLTTLWLHLYLLLVFVRSVCLSITRSKIRKTQSLSISLPRLSGMYIIKLLINKLKRITEKFSRTIYSFFLPLLYWS